MSGCMACQAQPDPILEVVYLPELDGRTSLHEAPLQLVKKNKKTNEPECSRVKHLCQTNL